MQQGWVACRRRWVQWSHIFGLGYFILQLFACIIWGTDWTSVTNIRRNISPGHTVSTWTKEKVGIKGFCETGSKWPDVLSSSRGAMCDRYTIQVKCCQWTVCSLNSVKMLKEIYPRTLSLFRTHECSSCHKCCISLTDSLAPLFPLPHSLLGSELRVRKVHAPGHCWLGSVMLRKATRVHPPVPLQPHTLSMSQ